MRARSPRTVTISSSEVANVLGMITLCASLSAAACATGEGARPSSMQDTSSSAVDAAERIGGHPLHVNAGLWEVLASHVEIDVDPARRQVMFSYDFESPVEPLEVQMPTRWAGQSGLLGQIRDLEASCVGDALTIELQEDGRLLVPHGGCRSLNLSYRVVVSDAGQPGAASRRMPRLSTSGMLLHGPTVIASPQSVGQGIGVEIVVPRAWTMSTNWVPVVVDDLERSKGKGRAVWRYVAHDVGHLLDSVIVGGALRHQSVALADGRTLHVALTGQLPLRDEELTRMLVRVLDAQRRFLPADWRWPAGTERLSVAFVGAGPTPVLEGGGRRGGFIAHLGTHTQPTEIAELIAHESFHVVNGHLLVHARDEEFATLWFKEGVTTYIAALTVVRAHLADTNWFRARLAELAGAYYGNPLSLTLPMSSVQRRFWTDVQARRLPYDKGALIGLLLDIKGQPTPEHTPIERWFVDLLQSVALEGRTYTNADLLTSMKRVLEADDTARLFFERYVSGVEALPLDRSLRRLDLHLSRAMAPAPYFGLQLGVDENGTFVIDVDPKGPAARAGIRRGDRLRGEPRLGQGAPGVALRVDVWKGRWLPMSIQPTRGQRERYAVEVLMGTQTPRFVSLVLPDFSRAADAQ